jgi:phosphonate transport system substrate-binding protein
MTWRPRQVALVVATLLTTSGCVSTTGEPRAGYPEPLVYSETPSGFSDVPQQPMQPVLAMLSRETGRTIRFQVGASYDGVIQGMSDGTVDIAALSPFSYVRAKRQNPSIIAVAAQIKERDDKPAYQAYGITRADSSIGSLTDFRGRTVCYVDDDSTSGYIYPSAALVAAGIRPLEDTVPVFKVDHEAVVTAVVDKQCDAGFAYDTMVDRQLIESGQIKPGEIKIVWKSEFIPGAPLVVSGALPTELRELLITTIQQKANSDYLRANGFCQGECPLGDANASGYRPVDDSSYDSIREVCQRLRHPSC